MLIILPVFIFSAAGLYSLIVKTLKSFCYPIDNANSSISCILKPWAGDGSLTPGANYAFIEEISKLAIIGPYLLYYRILSNTYNAIVLSELLSFSY